MTEVIIMDGRLAAAAARRCELGHTSGRFRAAAAGRAANKTAPVGRGTGAEIKYAEGGVTASSRAQSRRTPLSEM